MVISLRLIKYILMKLVLTSRLSSTSVRMIFQPPMHALMKMPMHLLKIRLVASAMESDLKMIKLIQPDKKSEILMDRFMV